MAGSSHTGLRPVERDKCPVVARDATARDKRRVGRRAQVSAAFAKEGRNTAGCSVLYIVYII